MRTEEKIKNKLEIAERHLPLFKREMELCSPFTEEHDYATKKYYSYIGVVEVLKWVLNE